jgi:putative transposase
MNTAISLTNNQSINLSNGQSIKLAGRHGIVQFANQEVTLVKFANGEHRHYPTLELKAAANDKKLHLMAAPVHLRCVVSLTQKQQKEHDRRLAYCEAFDQVENPCTAGIPEQIVDSVYEKIQKQHPKKPAWKTAHAWFSRYLIDGKDMRLQVALKEDQGFRVEAEVQEVMDTVIKTHYLKMSRPTVVFAYKQLQIAFAKGKRELEGFSIPSLSTFRRYIKGLSKYKVDLARYGKKYAENENRAALKVYKTSFPLERIECDACEINIGLLNEDGTYAGKVTIFLVMDVFSRAILGYAVQVGHTKESAAAVIHSLAHSMRLKADPAKHPMSGIGLCYVFDNGAGYRAEMTAKFLNAIGSDIVRCRSRRADEKPHVERAIGTMRQKFFKNLDGYLGKKSEVKVTEQTLKQAAKLSVSELMLMFEDYIQNVYHHTENRGIKGFTPFEMWKNHADEEEVITLADFDDRLMLRGNAKTLTCSISGGIAHRSQRFHSHELKEIVTRKLKNSGSRSCKMEVLIDDFDASAITVICDGIMIEVPNVDDVERDQGFSFLKSKTKQIDSANAPVPMSARQAQARNRTHRINGTHVESDTLIQDSEIIANTTTELEENHATTSTITETERNATDGFGVDDE